MWNKLKTKCIEIIKNPVVVLLFVFFIVSVCIHLQILFQDEYAVGIDGYYYATQVRFFKEHLRFASPDISLALYYLVAFSLLGSSVIITNKIAISLLAALLVWPAYLLGKRVYSEKSGFLFAVFCGSCSFLTHFTYEYVKNLGGIFVFLFFLNQLFKWMEKNTKRALIVLLSWSLIVVLTHKLMGALALVMFFAALVKMYYNNKRIIVLSMVPLVLVIVLLGFIVPNILHVTDIYRLHSLFTAVPQSGFIKSISTLQPSFIFVVELVLLGLAPFSLLIIRTRVPGKPCFKLCFILLLFILLNFPFMRFSLNNVSYRLFILTFIPSLLFLAVLLASFKQVKVLILIVIMALLLPYKYYTMDRLRNIRHTDYILYEVLLQLVELPADSLLVVHQGLDYYYSYHTKKRAFHYLPEPKHAKRPVYRLAYAVHPRLFARHLGKDLFEREVEKLPGFYYLMKEETWQLFVNRLCEDEKRRILTWRNPHSHRHGYMLRNQKFRK